MPVSKVATPIAVIMATPNRRNTWSTAGDTELGSAVRCNRGGGPLASAVGVAALSFSVGASAPPTGFWAAGRSSVASGGSGDVSSPLLSPELRRARSSNGTAAMITAADTPITV